MTTIGAPMRELRYNPATGAFDAYLDGTVVAHGRSYDEAEEQLRRRLAGAAGSTTNQNAPRAPQGTDVARDLTEL